MRPLLILLTAALFAVLFLGSYRGADPPPVAELVPATLPASPWTPQQRIDRAFQCLQLGGKCDD